ncbi:MAG: GNAT family N-acetyltransferase [Deltaproteobacteria bacterium]|nr:GNAT family N-acetyltransferase [Deltaproteobacteria bacterium]
MGYKIKEEAIKRKLQQIFISRIDQVYVAEVSGKVVGLISCHITKLFHQEGDAGRVTSLIINSNFRGKGIGKALVEMADKFFIQKGCIKSEVTSGDHRPETHEFYLSLGYIEDERRFLKIYR